MACKTFNTIAKTKWDDVFPARERTSAERIMMIFGARASPAFCENVQELYYTIEESDTLGRWALGTAGATGPGC